ncbi:MAG: pyruvate, phosphate dikinase [Marinifilaceae bacterium]|jgi:CheY-like chemotaxis protein|nr:pyruvate, phosphate dikinase [Marinifilaceae bacterium]
MSEIKISKIYKRKKNDRDIFQDLMPFKVREILLVATYYDAYTIVREGQFSDKIRGEYLQLNLYSAPRFTSVSSKEEAIKLMSNRHFDMVIVMAGLDKKAPIDTSEMIKEKHPHTPILMLVNNNSDLTYFTSLQDKLDNIVEKIFVWNGSTQVFMAMSKYIEDKMNLESDVKEGDVRIILLAEDSVKYYSRYLPILYTAIMQQTQNVINEEHMGNDMAIVLAMRVRPKIILVSNYEEAINIVDKYRNNIICAISDVRFYKEGKLYDDAGVELINYVNQKDEQLRIPCLLQSHDAENALRAAKIDADFINKNSDTLAHDINLYIHDKLGFGDFIFKNQLGQEIDIAHSVDEFEEKLETIPNESLLFHASRNGISTWLMARGEVNLAKRLRRFRINDFESVSELRKFCLDMFKAAQLKKLRGRIINFKPHLANSNRYITRMGKGSLGGKGRGMAFLCNFIENTYFKRIINGLNIQIPQTAIIGVIEFDKFIEENNLAEKSYRITDHEKIKSMFLKARLSENLEKRLMKYIKIMKKPLAVRSSGLFEDSLTQPFAGVYETFIIPNNHKDEIVRFKQLTDAIKLVYASIFTKSARDYFNAVDYKIEEEKMAVVLQEVVGTEVNQRYYPHISGVAQSYNYYPFSYMKPEDGFAVIALGLGMYVVGGEKTFRFCPKYPKLQLSSMQDQIKNSQKDLYALDMTHSEFDLRTHGEEAAIKKINIKDVEEDGKLTHCASVFDYQNDVLDPTLFKKGPRVVDFGSIIKYNKIPLAKSLEVLLDIFQQAMGSPVEIEYSLDMTPDNKGVPTLYLLQIKPLIRRENEVDINNLEIDEDKILLKATKGMGNGSIDHITDVIIVDNKAFDRTKTEIIAEEINKLNTIMKEQNREYILIGPGRWGTRDKFTGVPVLWSQISKAKVIVEQGLKDFPLDASLGSHFFHNVTSMNVGYFAIPFETEEAKVNIEKIYEQKELYSSKFVKHFRFRNPLKVYMDGKKQTAIITEA